MGGSKLNVPFGCGPLGLKLHINNLIDTGKHQRTAKSCTLAFSGGVCKLASPQLHLSFAMDTVPTGNVAASWLGLEIEEDAQ